MNDGTIRKTYDEENANGDTFKDFHDAIVEICKKYSIPYYDAYDNSGISPYSSGQNFMYFKEFDHNQNIHPTKEGYSRFYVPQLISLFTSILPLSINGGGE